MRAFYPFVRNVIDILQAGSVRMDPSLLRVEFLCDHRVSARVPLAEVLPKHGIGAEIGVFTGLFSTILLRVAQPKKMYFIDPWWKYSGSHFGDWGPYTDHGKLSTTLAHQVASVRIQRHAHETQVEIVVDYSSTFLPKVPDGYFDWVYLDSAHSYQKVSAELSMLRTKVKSGGIVAGDDWYDNPAHVHAGVAEAVKEAVTRRKFESLTILPAFQWTIRVP
jgi:hypothetical protein